MELKGKKVIVFAGPDFEDSELIVPMYRFLELGAEVKVIGLGEKSYKGKHGVPVDTHGKYEDVVNETWDAVVLPGGWMPDKVRQNAAALQIIQTAFAQNVPVGAICHAGWMLASAKVIDGRKLTSVPAIKDDLVHAGAVWQDAEVVVDGNLVTSRRPPDLPAFCRELVALCVKAPVTA